MTAAGRHAAVRSSRPARRRDPCRCRPARRCDCVAGAKGTPARAAAQRAVGAERDAVVRPRRRDASSRRRGEEIPARGEQPAGEQRLGKRHGKRAASGGAEHGEAVCDALRRSRRDRPAPRRAAARPPRSRVHSGALQAVVLRPIDRLRIGKVGENPRRSRRRRCSHWPPPRSLPSRFAPMLVFLWHAWWSQALRMARRQAIAILLRCGRICAVDRAMPSR